MKKLIATLLLISPLLGLADTHSSTATKITEKSISFAGDLRYRTESVEEDNKASYLRQRIRARIGAAGIVNNSIDVGLRFATGGRGITSTNQTLDEAGANKAFDVDLAFFNWKANDAIALVGGKMNNPFYRPGKSDLLWDSDWTPEGLSFAYRCNCESSNWYVSLSDLWIVSKKNKSLSYPKDAMLLAIQTGYSKPLARGSLEGGLGLYSINNLKGNLTIDSADTTASTYSTDYNVMQVYLQYKIKTANRPLHLYIDFVSNSEASDNNQGYLIGVQYGKAKKKGQWALGYNYRELQTLATLPELTDGDFAGGGTNGKGHKITYAHAIADNSTGQLSFYANKKGNGTNFSTTTNYQKVHLDFAFKF